MTTDDRAALVARLREAETACQQVAAAYGNSDGWMERAEAIHYAIDAIASTAGGQWEIRGDCADDVCQAAKRDGVLCAEDECDYHSGVRRPPPAAWSLPPEAEQATRNADAVSVLAKQAELLLRDYDFRDAIHGLGADVDAFVRAVAALRRTKR